MTPALFHPDAEDAFDLFMDEPISRARDLYEVDGEIAIFRRDGRVISCDIEYAFTGGQP